jgi:hypothetical protein
MTDIGNPFWQAAENTATFRPRIPADEHDHDHIVVPGKSWFV